MNTFFTVVILLAMGIASAQDSTGNSGDRITVSSTHTRQQLSEDPTLLVSVQINDKTYFVPYNFSRRPKEETDREFIQRVEKYAKEHPEAENHLRTISEIRFDQNEIM